MAIHVLGNLSARAWGPAPLLALLVCFAAAWLPSASESAACRYAPGEIIVKLREQIPSIEARSVLAEMEAVPVAHLDLIGADLCRIEASDPESLAALFRDDPRVEFIEPNFVYTVHAVPPDPEFSRQWSLRNTGQTGGTPGADIRAAEAWDVTTGSSGVVVAVLDSGIELDNPDLAPNIFVNTGEIAGNGVDDDGNGQIDDVHGWDFVNANADPSDDRGHGTETAGVIGAVSDTGGIAGVAWSVRLLPIKIIDGAGSTTAGLATLGIDYAVAMGARILNNSWGGGCSSEALGLAIERARDAGALFVAAAGNRGSDNDVNPEFPSSYQIENVLAVAATTDRDELWPLSNYGATRVHLAAPGVAIRTTCTGGRIVTDSGTSLAAPHVSGALALLLSRYPAMPAERAKQQILATAEPLPSLAGRMASGGRLDAAAALEVADTSAPGAVADLSGAVVDGRRIRLRWTAPGDDGSTGTVTSYEVRYSAMPLNERNFAVAAPASGAPSPSPAGSLQQMETALPLHATRYYVALRAADEWGNVSPLSNVTEITTGLPPDLEVFPTAFAETLFTGQAEARLLTLRNTGASTLEFELSTERCPLEAGRAGFARGRIAEPRQLPAPRHDPAADVEPMEVLILCPGMLPSRFQPICAALSALPGIECAGVWNIFPELPELSQLARFDSIILVSSGGSGPVWSSFCDLLADYVDGGGGLVLALDSFVEPGLAGRIAGFSPAGFAQLTGPDSSSLGAADSTHPILEGVATLESRDLAEISAAPGAYVAASWAGGEPLAVTKGTGIVALNVRIEGTETWSGDVPLLLANAARWANRPAAWLSPSPAAGEVAASQDLEIALTFDTRGQDPGLHRSALTVAGNDENENVAVIPVTLEIVAAPDIACDETALDFGAVTAGDARDLQLIVRNRGSGELHAERIGSSAMEFTAEPSSATIGPESWARITIRFRPAGEGPRSATLRIECDDPDEPVLSVALVGIGSAPPALVIDPASLSPKAHPGGACADTISIANPGAASLEWAVHTGSLPGPLDLAGVRVLWDAAHGQLEFADPPSTAFADLQARGAHIEINTLPLTAEVLEGAGVFWTCEHVFGWESFERDALAAWFAAGGAVLFEGDDEYSTEGFNYLFDGLGIPIRYTTGSPGYGSTAAIAAHPATEGVREIALTWPTATLTVLNPPSGALVRASQDGAVVAWAAAGAGRAIAVSDELFADGKIDARDNRGLAAGVIGWLAGPRWLRCEPASGSLAPGAAAPVIVSCDAARLESGEFSARLFVAIGEPARWSAAAPVDLLVELGPQLAVSRDSLAFAPLFAGAAESLSITVRNEGSRALEVTGIVSRSAEFSAAPPSFVLAPGESLPVTATFCAADTGAYESEFVFEANDWDGTPVVRVAGTVLPAPLPRAFALRPGAPNPFRAQTTIPFDLPAAAFVRMAIYDPAGRMVRTLIEAQRPAGRHEAVWSGRDASGRRAASGVYVCRIETPAFTASRRIVLIR